MAAQAAEAVAAIAEKMPGGLTVNHSDGLILIRGGWDFLEFDMAGVGRILALICPGMPAVQIPLPRMTWSLCLLSWALRRHGRPPPRSMRSWKR